MSRLDALRAVLADRLGPKADALAAGVLLDTMRAGYVLVHVHTELPAELREGGFLVRIAAELEADAAAQATYGALLHGRAVAALARADAADG